MTPEDESLFRGDILGTWLAHLVREDSSQDQLDPLSGTAVPGEQENEVWNRREHTHVLSPFSEADRG